MPNAPADEFRDDLKGVRDQLKGFPNNKAIRKAQAEFDALRATPDAIPDASILLANMMAAQKLYSGESSQPSTPSNEDIAMLEDSARTPRAAREPGPIPTRSIMSIATAKETLPPQPVVKDAVPWPNVRSDWRRDVMPTRDSKNDAMEEAQKGEEVVKRFELVPNMVCSVSLLIRVG